MYNERPLEVGDYIRIIIMDGEPQYSGREGRVDHIDDMGGVHGTWGGLSLYQDTDVYEILSQQ